MARALSKTGIEWIGDVPSTWKLIKGKYLFRQRNEQGNRIELQLLSPTQKYGVIPQTLYEELSGMKAVKLEANADYTTLKSIYAGDFCISLRSFQGGFEYSKHNGVVSPAYQVFYKIANLCDDYYRYLFKDRGFIAKMTSFTKTFRDGKSISFADFGNSLIPVPPKEEQEQIAFFLDSECNRIDAVIEQTRASIEEYKKLKQAVIHQAVTKGIRHNRAMKASGIDGVDIIRKDWKIQSLKTLSVILRGGSPRPIEEFISKDNTGYNWIRIGDSVKGSKYINSTQRKIIPEGLSKTRLIKKGSLILSNSMSFGQPYILNIDGCIHDGWVAFSEIKINQEFLYYFLLSEMAMAQFQQQVAGGVVQNLNVDKIGSTKIGIPDIEEQIDIVHYLDEKIQNIDSLIEKKEQLLSELESYKKSLIYEYVTGKKEVPA